MKERYIKQVEKELSLSHKVKKEVVRDLNEVFSSALEHGETEQQVIRRWGHQKNLQTASQSSLALTILYGKKGKGSFPLLSPLLSLLLPFRYMLLHDSGKYRRAQSDRQT